MGTRISTVSLGYAENEHDKMISTSKNVVDNGMYSTAGALVYTSPATSKIDYTKQLGKADAAQTLVKDGGSTHDTVIRDSECALLHAMNVANVGNANTLFRGNTTNLDLSGYPLSKEPSPVGLLPAPRIKEALKGKEPGSVKIRLEKFDALLSKNRGRTTFAVYVTDKSDSMADLKCVCRTTNSHKIINPAAVRGKDLYYYVTASNAYGESETSGVCRFMLN